jgi:hypothetical protein
VSCARREATTVAPQALTMMNSEFMLAQAKRLAAAAGATGDPLAHLWLRTLQRTPTAAERERAAGMALPQLALVLFNLNEFLYTD